MEGRREPGGHGSQKRTNIKHSLASFLQLARPKTVGKFDFFMYIVHACVLVISKNTKPRTTEGSTEVKMAQTLHIA